MVRYLPRGGEKRCGSSPAVGQLGMKTLAGLTFGPQLSGREKTRTRTGVEQDSTRGTVYQSMCIKSKEENENA